MRRFGFSLAAIMVVTAAPALALDANGTWMCKRADNYIVAALNITDEKYIVINNLGPSGSGLLVFNENRQGFVPKNGMLKAAMHITTGAFSDAAGVAALDLTDRKGAHLTCSRG